MFIGVKENKANDLSLLKQLCARGKLTEREVKGEVLYGVWIGVSKEGTPALSVIRSIVSCVEMLSALELMKIGVCSMDDRLMSNPIPHYFTRVYLLHCVFSCAIMHPMFNI